MRSENNYRGRGKAALFWAGIAFTLLAPVVIGVYFQDSSSAWIAVTCGVFVTLMAKFDDLVEFSLGPLRARMRETISEANATIDQLRKLAVTSARATLTDLMAGNFMDGTSLRTRLDLHDQFIDTLRRIGVPDLEIKESDEMWRKGIGIIYHRAVRKLLKEQLSQLQAESDAGKALRQTLDDFQDLLDFESWTAPSPERIENFLKDRNANNKENAEMVSDYRHFLTTGEIRRRDVFVKQ